MIELVDVRKSFAGSGGAALDGVSLSVARGEVFGVIGPSGAGKSTLIRLINALETPSGGRVEVGGVDVAPLPAAELRAMRRGIGMIFQNFGLLSSRTQPIAVYKDNAAQHPPIVDPGPGVALGKIRFKPSHLLVRQPVQVAHAQSLAELESDRAPHINGS